MQVELTEADLTAIEEALSDCLIYENEGDEDAQCEALAKVRNALGCTPRATAVTVRIWVDDAREEHNRTGNKRLRMP